MKKSATLQLTAAIIFSGIFMSFLAPAPPDDDYIILGWNDLGMHCSNKDFSKIAILPPFNNFRAQVIKKGNGTTLPEILTSGMQVNFEVPGNTYSVGKTNFWDYEDVLFGVSLPDNIGLTGEGLSGTMATHENYFWVDGIPITPYTDSNLTQEDPYQFALLELFDNNGQFLTNTQNVMPVSNEITCVTSGCHTSESQILDMHEDEGGFNPNATPVLCAQCHADAALGMPGNPEAGSLSYVMHEKHKEKTNDCYMCHPGPNTQCFRGVMHDAGMECQDCHGSMQQVAQSIENGRRPWLDEPTCGNAACHGPNFAEEPGKLFRESKGHGGLFCSACHGSPHATVPSTNDRDNYQNINLQGYAGVLKDCKVCHGVDPTGAGPHGIFAGGSSSNATLSDLTVDDVTISGFSPGILSYDYSLPPGTTTVPAVGAVPTDPEATIVITDATSVPGTTLITVTAADGITILIYSIDFRIDVPTIHFTEYFEKGVPRKYVSRNLNLLTGTWYGKLVKRNENSYSGNYSIGLKKEANSFLITPEVNSLGYINFYYRGDEDETGRFKVQKSVNGSSWTNIATVSYNDEKWYQFTYQEDDPSSKIKIRIYKNKKQKGNLLIDEFTLTGIQQSRNTPASNPGEEEVRNWMNNSWPEEDQESINIYANNGRIHIHQAQAKNGFAAVYSLSGQQLVRFNLMAVSEQSLETNLGPGIYIVYTSIKGNITTTKLIIH